MSTPPFGGERARLPELDVLRGIAIIAVVGLHASTPFLIAGRLDEPAGRIVAAVHLGCGFGVPLFVALSALGLALRHAHPFASLGRHLSFLARRAARLLPAYVTWSLVTAAVMTPDRLWPPGRPLTMLLTGTADAQFYFIPLIFELYLVWPLLAPAARAARRSLRSALLVLAAGIIFSPLWWKLHAVYAVPHGTLAMFPMWIVYVCLGVAAVALIDRPPRPRHAQPEEPARPGVQRTLKAGAAVVAATAATAVTGRLMIANFHGQLGPDPAPYPVLLSATIFQIPSMLYVLAACVLLALLAARVGSAALAAPLRTLGEHAYGIFLVHMLLLGQIIQRALPPPERLASGTFSGVFLIEWALCLALSYALVAGASRRALLEPLVSNRRTHRSGLATDN